MVSKSCLNPIIYHMVNYLIFMYNIWSVLSHTVKLVHNNIILYGEILNT
jgi:hypothetical protein